MFSARNQIRVTYGDSYINGALKLWSPKLVVVWSHVRHIRKLLTFLNTQSRTPCVTCLCCVWLTDQILCSMWFICHMCCKFWYIMRAFIALLLSQRRTCLQKFTIPVFFLYHLWIIVGKYTLETSEENALGQGTQWPVVHSPFSMRKDLCVVIIRNLWPSGNCNCLTLFVKQMLVAGVTNGHLCVSDGHAIQLKIGYNFYFTLLSKQTLTACNLCRPCKT